MQKIFFIDKLGLTSIVHKIWLYSPLMGSSKSGLEALWQKVYADNW